MHITRTIALVSACSGMLLVGACEKKEGPTDSSSTTQPSGETGNMMDNAKDAMNQAGEAAKETAEDVGEAVKEGAEKVGDAIDDATDG